MAFRSNAFTVNGRAPRACAKPCPPVPVMAVLPGPGAFMPVVYFPGTFYSSVQGQDFNTQRQLSIIATTDVQPNVTLAFEFWDNQLPYDPQIVTETECTLTRAVLEGEILDLQVSDVGCTLVARSLMTPVSTAGVPIDTTGNRYRIQSSCLVRARVYLPAAHGAARFPVECTQFGIGFNYLADDTAAATEPCGCDASDPQLASFDPFPPALAGLYEDPNAQVTVFANGDPVGVGGSAFPDGYNIVSCFTATVPPAGSVHLRAASREIAAGSPNFPTDERIEFAVVHPVGRYELPTATGTLPSGAAFQSTTPVCFPTPGIYYFQLLGTTVRGSWSALRDTIAQPFTEFRGVSAGGVVHTANNWFSYSPASLLWVPPSNVPPATATPNPQVRVLVPGTDGNNGAFEYQVAAGQLAPVAFRPSPTSEDAPAAVAFLVTAPIARNSAVFFTTQPWSQTALGFGAFSVNIGTGDAAFENPAFGWQWNTPAAIVPAGTVVLFSDIGAEGAVPTVTVSDVHGVMGPSGGAIGSVSNVDPSLGPEAAINSVTVLSAWFSLDPGAAPITSAMVTQVVADTYNGDIPVELSLSVTAPYWRFPVDDSVGSVYAPGTEQDNGIRDVSGATVEVLPGSVQAAQVNGNRGRWNFNVGFVSDPAGVLPTFTNMTQWFWAGFYRNMTAGD